MIPFDSHDSDNLSPSLHSCITFIIDQSNLWRIDICNTRITVVIGQGGLCLALTLETR
jgi:hypothetical protein